MYCSCGFILQSSCLRYISSPLHWCAYFCAPQIFCSSVYYNILNGNFIICCWCGAAGRHESAESFDSVKMASEKCKDHSRHALCFGEKVCVRNLCSFPSPLVCGSREDVNRDQYFGRRLQTDFFLSPRMLQSVRRHLAIVLTVTINGM
jgi:hypothetical protein